VIGALQANEALKIVVGYGDPLVGRLLTFDAHGSTFGQLRLRRDPSCPTCGDGATGNGKVPGELATMAARSAQPATAGVSAGAVQPAASAAPAAADSSDGACS
jgi:hypothetical protein